MKSDNQDNFRAFVAARMSSLRVLAFLACGDWHTAEDAVSNALVKLYPRFNRLERPDLYVQTMVFRAAIDETRRPWWRRERSASDTLPDPIQLDQADVTDERLRMRAALLAVPTRQRAVLVLRYYQGLNVQETAEVLGCSEGNIKSQTYHGLKALRRLLGDERLESGELSGRGAWTDAGV
ncbi:RNA polymerase sigma24 factor [Virgisporangium aliadipatigenens]|uniref:RNA polymerase sigma24 factor n=1 Tax=Virgisporangium aliadipatigenens TaxID=741659 RepID=A0A8J3YTH1_9ACTN|nr:SigE family RNA polymerase sigma factor [Virgisporangium aliadipatigenens]GIJ50327.1 RNA polymerase sigma24 factor [Virgisporangium aliadipatigenens]